MIIYATKQTFERYKLKLPHELTPPINKIAEMIIEMESGNELLEWGAKLFYFDGKKCIQVVNFASKFTLCLVDIKIKDLELIGHIIIHYLLTLYEKEPPMLRAIEKMAQDSPAFCFAKLTNRSAISTLNLIQRELLDDGRLFSTHLKDGILHTIEINRFINFKWIFGVRLMEKDGHVYAGDRFRELLLERYGN
ncbi:DUF6933 domain-containing protein [Treponema phagedenis]|uniref:DUF6933 domain-containing protein n=1 Tax=Treponema phagedenis TaxID=162 RepID=UPI000464D54B|nr:hypothetical protein [Treponema phagedenis]NVP23169.1 hypothetical protein [Treponema phagedenis]QEJ94840.1 hypothetical protein FUT79_06200 [Treponema phagedenis]QEK05748.1 hypothetical protein FUT80_02785 [Treponema phagedenis]QKS92124.1 hypothetical protein HPJ96_05825 [Treponema phagedenis]QLC58033.1 hypothetical protein HW453_03850 [Treponema phagedenis]